MFTFIKSDTNANADTKASTTTPENNNGILFFEILMLNFLLL